MNSGLNDFELHGVTFDEDVLRNSTQNPDVVHSPFETFSEVASFDDYSAEKCKSHGVLRHTKECTFICEPGTCFKYSTLGFMVGGLILLNHAPEGQQSWETYDLLEGLGLDKSKYKQLLFKPEGIMHEQGLTTVGDSNTGVPIWN